MPPQIVVTVNEVASAASGSSASVDADRTQRESLLHQAPVKLAAVTHMESPSTFKQKQRIPSVLLHAKKSSLRRSIRLTLVFVLGLVVGAVVYSYIYTGMIDIRGAILAANRAKRNAAMLAGTERNAARSFSMMRVQEDAFPLRVMTFNLRQGTARDDASSWQFRRVHAADIINRYVPVVFGTQEGISDQLADLQALLTRPYDRFGDPREPNDEHSQIFYDTSVVERLDGGTFWLSETPHVPYSLGWDSACVRIATWCRFRFLTTQQQFYAVNAHLDSSGTVARLEGAKVVWREMQKIRTRDALPEATPLLLTGDFNTFRRSNAFQYLTNDSSGPQFQDSWTASGVQVGNVSCTYHKFLGPKYDTLQHDDWSDPDMDLSNGIATNHIDFVLARPPLPAIMTEVITEAWHGRYPSDHYPVMATLLFPSAAELPPPGAK
jgi:endonuclease/exonuclease/phosphatase family metal-dependent hydrolase